MLRDPRQKRFFKAKDMSDLFQLGDQYAQAPETAQIFAGLNTEIPLLEEGKATGLTTPSLPATASAAEASQSEVPRDSRQAPGPASNADGTFSLKLCAALRTAVTSWWCGPAGRT